MAIYPMIVYPKTSFLTHLQGSQAQELSAADGDLQNTQKELDAANAYYEKLRLWRGFLGIWIGSIVVFRRVLWDLVGFNGILQGFEAGILIGNMGFCAFGIDSGIQMGFGVEVKWKFWIQSKFH